MATIRGTWKFNDVITNRTIDQMFSVYFTSNTVSFSGIALTPSDTFPMIHYTKYEDTQFPEDLVYYEAGGGWQIAKYQTVNFGAEQYIDDILYEFIAQNAVKQPETEFEIDILSNGTKTLKTKGKYCDRDIHVNVRVSGSTAPYVIPAGTYEAGNVQLVEFEQNIRFTSNGTEYTGMWMTYWSEGTSTTDTLAVWTLSYVYGSGSSGGNVYKYWPSKGYGLWHNEADSIISVPEQQEVSATYLDWFTRSFAGIAPEAVPEYDGTVTVV